MSNSIGDLLRFFYVQRIAGFDVPSAPVLDEATSRLLSQRLASATFYLEFGSGGSTLLADRLGIQGISVESDRYYARTIRSALSQHTMIVVSPDIGMTGPWGWPLLKRPTARRMRRWRRYIKTPFDGLDTFPDLILVDGRFRVACSLECARQAWDRGRSATLVLDDYTHRPAYHIVENFLGEPELLGRAALFRIGHQRVADADVWSALRDPF